MNSIATPPPSPPFFDAPSNQNAARHLSELSNGKATSLEEVRSPPVHIRVHHLRLLRQQAAEDLKKNTFIVLWIVANASTYVLLIVICSPFFGSRQNIWIVKALKTKGIESPPPLVRICENVGWQVPLFDPRVQPPRRTEEQKYLKSPPPYAKTPTRTCRSWIVGNDGYKAEQTDEGVSSSLLRILHTKRTPLYVFTWWPGAIVPAVL